jgi:hypothetical protein
MAMFQCGTESVVARSRMMQRNVQQASRTLVARLCDMLLYSLHQTFISFSCVSLALLVFELLNSNLALLVFELLNSNLALLVFELLNSDF